MSAVAPALEAFFTERLMSQKRASRHTIAAYRDTFRLLLAFAQARSGKAPSRLEFDDLDAPAIGAFLDHLEHVRGNSPQSRNARLAAVHSLFRFAALRHPEHAALIARVLAIPSKRFARATVSFLSHTETQALLAAPDRDCWMGRRDHALLTVAVQTGLRVSELAGLCYEDVQLGTGANVRCHGKGRRQRCTPLTPSSAKVLGAWIRERAGQPGDPLFPTSRGRTPQPRRHRPARRQTRRDRRRELLLAARQGGVTPHPAPHVRHEPAPRRRGRRDHCAAARPLQPAQRRELHPRRHEAEGTSTRPHQTSRDTSRALPAA